MSQYSIDPKIGKLTHRERFRRLMHFQTVDRGIHWEFGYLDETTQRWYKEGLPRRIKNYQVETYFGVESSCGVPIFTDLIPPFKGKAKVLEEKANSRILQHPDGTVEEVQKTGDRTTIPHYIKMPIANRADWLRFKERLDPNHPQRWKFDWAKLGKKYRQAQTPVGIGLGSYFGVVRNWIGFENIALMCYDDRPLIEEIIATLTEVQYTQLQAALKYCEADFAGGWEDMCFRNGPIISPSMYRELVFPHLKRVCDLLRTHGCDVIWTDCDGNINDLVPLWLEAGQNCMFPVEVHAGSDPVALRKKYGKQILLVGGIAKYELAKGKKAILAELKRITPVVEEGGYIPHGDHRIPDDVPYENYKYYIREKLALLGWPQAKIKSIPGLKKRPRGGPMVASRQGVP